MNINFFDWLRDGVRRSVLLGVTDAVEQMGMPADEAASREKILGFLQENQAVTESTPRKRISSSSSTPRKLGRTLADIRPAK